ncbi:MAG: FIST N-terminal domain-containing protein [Candidatus Omnitrophota bacterium]
MSTQIGVGLGTQKDPLAAVQDAVRQARLNLATTKIDLAIVFSSVDFAHLTVLQTINNLLGSVPLIGSSTLAVITDQGIFKHGLIIMLLSFPEDIYFNIAEVKEISKRPASIAGQELGEKLLYGFKGVRRDLSMIFSDGLIPDGSGLIWGLQESLGRSFPLAGASASDNLTFKKTYLYFNQELLSDAACGILWGGKLNFGLGIKHGWKPIGKPHSVTRAAGNVVYEIDGAPAAQLYADYLAYDLNRLKRELKYISVFYPLGMYIPGEDEYLLRNILSIQDDGSLTFQGSVAQDTKVRLMIGTKESCLQATRQALDEAKKNLLGRAMKFVIIFNSASRYMLLGREAKKEIEIIKSGLDSNTPVIGIYTYGEQAPLKAVSYQGRAYFHNQTIVVLGVGSSN